MDHNFGLYVFKKFLIPHLCQQDIVLHFLPRLHYSDNRRLNLVLPVVVQFLPRVFPVGV